MKKITFGKIWKTIRNPGFAFCAGLLATGALSPELYGKGQPLIVENGKARAQILIAEKPPRTVKIAAEELQTYLKKISGAELPIATESGKEWPVHIYIGKSPGTEKLGINDAGLKDGAFRMVSGKDWLAIIGNDTDYVPKEPWAHDKEDMKRVGMEWDKITGEHFGEAYEGLFRKRSPSTGLWEFDLDNDGSFNGVNQFLRDLGVRWYAPGELGEVIPSLSSIALPSVDKTVRPDFSLRYMLVIPGAFFNSSKDEILWQMRLGLNQGDLNRSGAPGHGLLWVLQRDEMKSAHPDYYLLFRGARRTGSGKTVESPCLSSEGLFQANVKFLRAVFDQYDFPMYCVMPTDGYMTLCECEKCKGKATLERGMAGSLSDYVWDYVNRVAKELYKTHPDKKIHCTAYTAFLLPPEKIDKLSPNIVVGIARGGESVEFFHKLRREWLKKVAPGNLLFQWGYYHLNKEGRPTEGMPAIFPQLIVDDLRDMKGIAAGGGVEVVQSVMNDINVYVTARFWWDVDQDLHAMMEEYYTLYYGPAKEQMKAYFEFSEKNWEKMPKSVKAIDEAFELIAAARKAAGDTPYGKRIDAMIAFMEPMKKTRERLIVASKNIIEVRGLVRNDKDIAMDGKLTDPFWKELPVYELKTLDSKEKPAIATDVRMGWSGNYLYVGIRCQEPLMDKLNLGPRENNDAAIFESDSVEVMMETQYRTHYQVTVDPAGAIYTVDWSESPANSKWISDVKVATHRDKDYWSVELRIPVTGGDVDKGRGVVGIQPTAAAPWRINICRLRINGEKREGFTLSGNPFHDTPNFAKFITVK